jgi:CO/xanthine dehydrogenase FAD-binding subunit
MNQSAYLRPASLNEALHALASGPLQVLAGGTDFFPGHTGASITGSILDITAVPGLAGLHIEDDMYRIGAATTWSTLVRASLPPQLHGLQAAACEVGGIQVQNTGTLAGNLCNASPAADGIPALMALDAVVELTSLHGTRRLSVQDFLLGSRKTARAANELVTAILIPHRPHARASFLKLGHRRYLVISIVMVSVVMEIDEGCVTHAAIAVGSCSAVARRLSALEKKIIGQPVNSALNNLVTEEDLAVLTPIDDVRGTGAYRLDAAQTLVRRAIAKAADE